jgi:hypothetical protein
VAINQRKTTGTNAADDDLRSNSVEGQDPTDRLRTSPNHVRETPAGGATDQSDAPGSQLDEDRHAAVQNKSRTIGRDSGAGGVAI